MSSPPSTPVTPSSASTAFSLSSITPFSTTSVPRLQALYSDFSRQKHSNAASYLSNVDWWHHSLEVLVNSGIQHMAVLSISSPSPSPKRVNQHGLNLQRDVESERLVLHAGRDLMELLKMPNVGKPLALGAVLSELRTSRTSTGTSSIIPLPEFLSAKTTIYDPGSLPLRIAALVIGKPLWWALEQVGIVGEEGLLGSGYGHASSLSRSGSGRGGQHKDASWWGDYVFVGLVERAADKVTRRQEERMTSTADALYTFDGFRTAFAGVTGGGGEEDRPPLRELDAKVLIKYLERDRGVLVVDKDVIKFIDEWTSEHEHAITAVDRGIMELKGAVRNLQLQVESLHKKIDECARKVSSSLQQKHKPTALSYLRSRKQLEDLLSKRLGALDTLESTLISVEAAAGDVEIMKSYESSAATLRAILAHPSLERSAMDKTLEALAEANGDAKELDEAVRIGGDVAVGVVDSIDENELEEEWKALAREAEAEVAMLMERAGKAPTDFGQEREPTKVVVAS